MVRFSETLQRDWLEVSPFTASFPRIASVTNYLEDDGFLGETKKLILGLAELSYGYLKRWIPKKPLPSVSSKLKTKHEKVITGV